MAIKDTLTNIRFYTDEDAYTTATDNRPLTDLKLRDDEVADAVDALTSSTVTALAGKVDNTRQVIAGDGLSGGGALSGDVTISVGLPSTLTTSSVNSSSAGTHSHEVTFPVVSVAGKTGAVTLAKADVGLGNVDNTTDLGKPISTATQTALDGKAPTAHIHAIADVTGLQAALDAAGGGAHTHAIADVTGLQTALDGKMKNTTASTVLSAVDWNTLTTPGFSGVVDAGSTNGPTTGTGYWYALVFEFTGGTTNLTQLAIPYGTTGNSGNIAFRTRYNGTWEAWKTLSVTGHGHAISDVTGLQTALDGKVAQSSSLGASYNLNNAVTSGFFRVEATPVNAPANTDYSTLIVSRNGDTILQILGDYDTGNLWTRTANGIGATPTWTAWKRALAAGAVDATDVPQRTDWNGRGGVVGVVGQLGWKNYGNNHTVFDASAGTTPTGAACNNTNPDNAWAALMPTLMGYNGSQTYGVRVDRARYAESLTSNITINGVAANVGSNITIYDSSKLPTSGGTVSGRLTVFTNPGTSSVYNNGQLELLSTDGSDVTLGFHRVGNTAAQLRHSGNGLILSGTSQTASADFYCYGNVTAYSDIRYKKNIVRIQNALEKVGLLSGYTFERTNGEGKSTGVIAQEVIEVLPEAVSIDDDGYMSVAYGNMMGLMIEAIKELKAEVASLKAQLEAK